MRHDPSGLLRNTSRHFSVSSLTSHCSSNLVSIENGTFFRHSAIAQEQYVSAKDAMFPNTNFRISSHPPGRVHWAIVGHSNAGKTTFLEILRGSYLCYPPLARTFPYLASAKAQSEEGRLRNPARAIQYVGFNERGRLYQSSVHSGYMSARYESRRDETDYSVLDYLQGRTELNPDDGQKNSPSGRDLERVIRNLHLEDLIMMPVTNLSNGQSKRARIAKALLGNPELLLLDEPFIGLDPPTNASLSSLLHGLAKSDSPRILLALRPQDLLPEWITHVVRLGPSSRIADQGERGEVLANQVNNEVKSNDAKSKGIAKPQYSEWQNEAEVLLDMQGVQVTYGSKTVLGSWSENQVDKTRHGLWWTVRRGQRWGVFGPNGSGKTTIISLICSDHPQAYSAPVKIFGRGRLPEQGSSGISIFDIQARIGQSSPEVHTFFPKRLSIRQTLENAWADTFLGTPKLDTACKSAVDTCLRTFEPELNPNFGTLAQACTDPTPDYGTDLTWADSARFGHCTFSTQRVALFLRAVIKKPDIVVLDEAFSGMDEEVRNKCMRFLDHGMEGTGGLEERQALICISHIKEEVPPSVREWLCLPEAGEGRVARFGKLDRPLAGDEQCWDRIWNTH